MWLRWRGILAAMSVSAGSISVFAEPPASQAKPLALEAAPGGQKAEPKGSTDPAHVVQTPFKVLISGKQLQKVGEGLLFNVEVVNTSSTAISLYDPSDVMDISLVGDDGFPCALPPVTPMLMIKDGDRPKLRKQLDEQRAFKVVQASATKVTEGTKSLADLNDAGEVLLKPGERLAMAVRITKTLDDAPGFLASQKQHAAMPGSTPPVPETKAIAIGQYMVRVLIPFVSNGDSKGTFLISNEIKIDLK